MDLKMPSMNSIQATRQIRHLYPHMRVLVLTIYDADEWIFDAIRVGQPAIYSRIPLARN